MYGNFGEITFAASKGTSVDYVRMSAALNEYKWCPDGGTWIVGKEGATLIFDGGKRIHDPSLFPRFNLIYEFEDDDGESFYKKENEMNEDDWEEFISEDFEEVELATLVKKLSKEITNGYVKIVMTELNKDSSNLVVEVLTISSDFHGNRSRLAIVEGVIEVNYFEEV